MAAVARDACHIKDILEKESPSKQDERVLVERAMGIGFDLLDSLLGSLNRIATSLENLEAMARRAEDEGGVS